MDAIATRYDAPTKAFLAVPLVGAFFLNLLNAGTINAFMALLKALA